VTDPRPWRLTPRAEAALVEIALWTLETFGPAQADRYEAELLDRCAAAAEGRALTQDCALLAGEAEGSGLRFVRAGEHFALLLELPEEVVFVDFLHSRSDLPARLAALRRIAGA
jgi:plasmid stabilization system protein ParE